MGCITIVVADVWRTGSIARIAACAIRGHANLTLRVGRGAAVRLSLPGDFRYLRTTLGAVAVFMRGSKSWKFSIRTTHSSPDFCLQSARAFDRAVAMLSVLVREWIRRADGASTRTFGVAAAKCRSKND